MIIPTIIIALLLWRKLRNPKAIPALPFLFMEIVTKQNSYKLYSYSRIDVREQSLDSKGHTPHVKVKLLRS